MKLATANRSTLLTLCDVMLQFRGSIDTGALMCAPARTAATYSANRCSPGGGSRPVPIGSRSHRSESPTGYSSTGCSPAEPASASPVTDIVAQSPIQRGNQMRCPTPLRRCSHRYGTSEKSQESGGRHGLGKSRIVSASKLQMFFGVTVRSNCDQRQQLLQGQICLKQHMITAES